MSQQTTSAGIPGAGQLHLDVAKKLRSELNSDERITWAAQPLPRLLRRKTLPIVLFAIPWTAFAIFWTVAASAAGGLFGLFGVPFVLIGIAMFASPFFAGRHASRSVYAITNQRVIAIEARMWSGLSIISYLPDALTTVERREHKDGSGDIILARRAERDSKGRDYTAENGLMGIADVVTAEKRVRELIALQRS